MSRFLALALAGLLCGCAAVGAPRENPNLGALLEHIEGCDREYTGGTGLGAAFTFHIACKARPAEVTPPTRPEATAP